MEKTLNIGVLSLQGSVIEHMEKLRSIPGINPLEVKDIPSLNKIHGLILPGGESTTLGKLLCDFNLFEPLQNRIKQGMPVWGTCAGMILLADEVLGERPHLALMDIKVRRNAYGSQRESFVCQALLPDISPSPLDLVFIRAPWIEEAGPTAKIIGELDGRIIAARQGHMLATSFHPELTEDNTIHNYFVNMVKEQGNSISCSNPASA